MSSTSVKGFDFSGKTCSAKTSSPSALCAHVCCAEAGHAGLGRLLGCGRSFNVRSISTVINCRRRACSCERAGIDGLKLASTTMGSLSTTAAPCSATNCKARCTTHSIFKHTGCTCGDECLLRFGLHCSNSSEFSPSCH